MEEISCPLLTFIDLTAEQLKAEWVVPLGEFTLSNEGPCGRLSMKLSALLCQDLKRFIPWACSFDTE